MERNGTELASSQSGIDNFIALGGLPRTGSTLLSSILFQNPEIHTEGNSALCQLMWDMKVSCQESSLPYLIGSYRLDVPHTLLSSLPGIYYNKVKASTVFDKNFSWVTSENVQVIRDYIRPDPKVIVMVRPIEEIIASFARIRKQNGWTGDLESDLMAEDNDLIRKPLYGVEYARENNNGEFLFIEYDDLVDYTEDVLKSIYDFCEIEYFQHDLNNIENKNPENDVYLNLSGLHDIRPTISRRVDR